MSLAALVWAGASAAKERPAAARPQSGTASYFGAEQTGKTTASGQKAKPQGMTAASRTLPLGTKAKVTNKETGKSVKVTVTDRGPYAEHRVVDVSDKAAGKLGMKKSGVAPVQVQPLHTPKSAP